MSVSMPIYKEGAVATFDKCPSCGRKGTFDGVPIYECRKSHHLFCVQCAIKMGKRTDSCPIGDSVWQMVRSGQGGQHRGESVLPHLPRLRHHGLPRERGHACRTVFGN